MNRRAWRGMALSMCISLCSTAAQAEAPARTSPARTSPETKQQARQQFERANAHFQAGRYEEAAEAYQAAYKLLPTPELLFNIAQSYRLGGNAPRALEYYRNYIAVAPVGPGTDEARKHIATLLREPSSGAEDSKKTPPPSLTPAVAPSPSANGEQPPALQTPAPADEAGRPSRVGPLVLGITGAAMAITGGILVALVGSDFSERKSTPCGRAGTCAPSSWEGLETQLHAGYGLLAAGGVAAAAGAIWWMLEPSGQVERDSRPKAFIHPTPVGFLAGARF